MIANLLILNADRVKLSLLKIFTQNEKMKLSSL
jgi:hypothetical protein